MEIWSGPFTCYYRYPPDVRFAPQDLANNHLLTADDSIRDRLGGVHRGDQVRVRGLLVDYQMDDWKDFWRETSTVRHDDGCEVVFVESFEVVREGAPRLAPAPSSELVVDRGAPRGVDRAALAQFSRGGLREPRSRLGSEPLTNVPLSLSLRTPGKGRARP